MTAIAWPTCKSLARSAWTRTRALAHPTIEHAAHAAGLDRSHLSRWESERCEHPAPLAALWSRELVPDAELDALIDVIRTDRAAQVERAVLATPKGAIAATMESAAHLLAASVRVLADGRVTPAEAAAVRPHLMALGAIVRRTIKVIDEAAGADVVPLRRAGGAR